MLKNAPRGEEFFFWNGTAKNLKELADYLKTISYEEFYTYVNKQKNDFANWVRYVLGEEELANRLEKVTSIVETIELINDFLKPILIKKNNNSIQTKIEEELKKLDEKKIEEEELKRKLKEEYEESIKSSIPEEKGRIIYEESKLPLETTQLLVKEFIYGFIFGLIIGFILARIISLGFS